MFWHYFEICRVAKQKVNFTLARLTLLAKVMMLHIYHFKAPDVLAKNRPCSTSIKHRGALDRGVVVCLTCNKILRDLHTMIDFMITRKGKCW